MPTSAAYRTEIRSRSPIPMDRMSSTTSRSCGSTTRRHCRCRMRRRRTRTTPSSASIFPAAPASVATQLNAALGATGLQFSNPSGTTLEVLDSGSPAITVNSVSTTATATSLTGGSGALPLFVDGTTPFTGAITAAGPESIGYAGRIAVNSALIADPSKLVTYQTSPRRRPATRPGRTSSTINSSMPRSNILPRPALAGPRSPFQGTLSAYMSQMVSMQSIAANAANNLQAGQDIVVNALQTRFNSTSARQYRHRNGEFAHAAKRLRRECAGDVDSEGDVGCLDADVM